MSTGEFARRAGVPCPRRLAGLLLTLSLLLLPSTAFGNARDDLAIAIAGAWLAQQRSDGQFGDSLNGGQPKPSTRYAEAMLGYGLLQTGLRTGRRDLVDAVVVLELCRSGIGRGVPGSILARRSKARRAVDRLLDEAAVGAARASRIGRHDAVLLSDPPQNPLAYHGLTLGMLARAIDLGGGHAPARRLLAAMVNASWALTAPDGDLAYTGRSSEQSWALALTAYGDDAELLLGVDYALEALRLLA